MSHPVKDSLSTFSSKFSSSDECFQLVKCFWHDIKLAVLVEDSANTLLHIRSLPLCIFIKKLLNNFRSIAHFLKLFNHCLSFALKVISLHHNSSFRLNSIIKYKFQDNLSFKILLTLTVSAITIRSLQCLHLSK